MTKSKIVVVFYSTYGTNHGIAVAAAEAAEAAGAEVRLRRIPETAPDAVVASQEAWKAQADRMADIDKISNEDLLWADGFYLSSPTRFGGMASQTRAWLDTLGGLWMAGSLAGKTITASATAQNRNGGTEGAIQQTYVSAMHFGMIPIAPGYTDPVKSEDGGNPYGFSAQPGELDETGRKSVAHQARRLVDLTTKLAK
ncbi:NAD(P)H-dependent oxidoreductase [Pseudogemmobacter sp. W21_MBD1_M6]|uniref:NAD(P)H-dependent oxidoreductase n=1 Tax=Pseudogemmobacter sp. W21_MBD1_M6 TaxID=3240271 RepID=UPI003F95F397